MWDRVVVTSVIWLSTGWMATTIKNDWLIFAIMFFAVLVSVNIWVGQNKKEK